MTKPLECPDCGNPMQEYRGYPVCETCPMVAAVDHSSDEARDAA